MDATPVYFCLGANQGDRAGALREAYRRLRAFLREPRASGIYETQPMYVVDQPPFLNAACMGETRLAPLELLRESQGIESALGRVRDVPKGPRTIDIDILLYGGIAVRENGLVIPHPGIRERPFVLVPLLELSPGLRDPLTGEPYRVYLDSLSTEGVSSSGETLDG